MPRAAVAHENQGGEQGNAADLILAAFLRLGANIPDTWIAREVGGRAEPLPVEKNASRSKGGPLT